jgi:hypothetical protein
LEELNKKIMNFLFIKTTWSNLELYLLKICIICSGIATGICFYDILKNFINLFLIAFGVTGIWAVILWIKKMKAAGDAKSW